jgi:polyhydroxybutyrate depolymerase
MERETLMRANLRTLLAALLLAALLPAGSAWSQRRDYGPDEHRMVQVQGSGRIYYLHFPAGSRAAPWSLVLMLHPTGSDAQEAMAVERWTEASDQNGFILVGLEARAPRVWLPSWLTVNPHVWNSGDPGVQDQNILAGDDVAYANAVLEALMRQYTIDTNRVYAVGFSSGGAMVQRLGLELGQRFAAIAAVGGLRIQDTPPRAPLSVMLVYGRQDPVTPYDGGTRRTPWGDTPNQPPVSASIAAWVRDLHCAPEALAQQPGPQVLRETWNHCDGGSEVQAVSIADLGYHWPGGRPDRLPADMAGPASKAFDATAEIWAFFAAHARHGLKPVLPP